MGLLVMKKSIIFLLTITLPICCSSYGAGLRFGQLGAGERAVTLADTSLDVARTKGLYPNAVEPNPKTTAPFKTFPHPMTEALGAAGGESTEANLEPFFIRKLGEMAAKKFGGEDARRGFRVGWKLGKRILAVERKCKKFEDKVMCQQAPGPCSNDTRGFCVITLVQNYQNSTWDETCIQSCTFPDITHFALIPPHP